MPEFAELVAPDSWVHVPNQILKSGRITHWADPALNEDDKATKLAELGDLDPEIDRLRGITEDRPFEPFYETNWLVKTVGDA